VPIALEYNFLSPAGMRVSPNLRTNARVERSPVESLFSLAHEVLVVLKFSLTLAHVARNVIHAPACFYIVAPQRRL
jgi:hypothetical protein